ncbi:jg24645 [Pararge aegeria aegeria]|uniref:Jg24645 protein n=1 Tax=Pararge aegeria aegeria TaxID=348720 RepID=A0A8S4QPS1_9NEOP|nr:jg24645 [Pararge aegeria aegeria]
MAYETLGATREQVSKVFSLTEERSEVVERFINLRTSVLVNNGVFINLLNFIFYDENFHVLPDSIKRLENDFRFISQRLNFGETNQAANAAMRTLKEYRVPLRTLIRTEDFVDSTMIMCNYLAFKAKWANPFNISNTMLVQYGNKTKKMMSMKGRLRSSNFDSLKATVTEVPYEGDGKYCMLLIRPQRGYSIKQVYGYLRKNSLKDVLVKLESDADEFGLKDVEVKLPRYATNSRVILNRPLFKMGLSDMFDSNFANFDNFADDKIYIYEIMHRVTVVITESETIVHTTTPAYSFNRAFPSEETAVAEPFVYFIIEKTTATILFGGSYSRISL